MNKTKLAVGGLVITSLMLIATSVLTYAWFDGSSNLAIDNFNITFVGKEISASTDNATFKEVLTNDDFEEVGKYKPVSSMFMHSWLDEKTERPTFYDLSSKKIKKQVLNEASDFKVASKGFFSQQLYIKCTSDATIALDTQNIFAFGKDSENDAIASKLQETYPEYTHDEIKENLNKVADSLRFSLLIENDELNSYAYYIIDPHKQSETYLGGILDTDLDSFYDSFEGKEVLYGEVSNSENLVYSNNNSPTIENSYSVFEANTKVGVEHLDVNASMQNGLKIAKENSLSLEEAKSITFDVASGVSKRIVLSIYLEGWDLDNTNLNMYSHFACGISFKIADGNGGN